MGNVYRCSDCGAHFRATHRPCGLCGTEREESIRDTCSSCGGQLNESPTQTCPLCGSDDVERASIA